MPGVCPRCLREVYFAEEKLALGKVWHTFCFSCRNCRKLLDSWTVATHCGELFCRSCYTRLFSTTAVRPPFPVPIGPIFSSVDKKDLADSPGDTLLSDCCCCCYHEENCTITEATEQQDPELLERSSNCPSEKRRLRGGGCNEEDLEAETTLELGDDKRSSERDITQLDLRSSQTIICDRPSGPTAVTAWYNKHHSASQGTFNRPPSARRNLPRPSSTPVSGEKDKRSNACNPNCSGNNRRPGSPCRSSHKHCEHSKPCNRHYCHEFQQSDRIGGSQEQRDITRECRGRNFVQNYRNHLRRVSPLCPKITLQGSTTTYYPAMQNIIDEKRGTVDLLSLENSACRDSGKIDKGNNSSDVKIDRDTRIDEDSNDIPNWDEDVRLRGGCGGGGSGCCCSSGGARIKFAPDHSIHNSCGKRYQTDRSSTIEGACGCSGFGKSGCGSGASSGGCCGTQASSPSQIGGCCGTSCDESNEGSCATKAAGGCRLTGYETCPPRSPDSCTTDPSSLSPCTAVACSPPCSGRKGCCPPAGCRPVRRRIVRCNTPCTGDTQSCGGGGCCGSGCRGGCGKPGQTCLPLRPCTIPPCQPHPRGAGGSPCLPPRSCAPQPPCCRIPVILGTPSGMSGGGGSGCCRSGSPGGRSAGGGGGCSPLKSCQQQDDTQLGSCCQPKLPPGCECLGGGQDCQRCGRKVYQAEMQIASGVPYHNICFSCFCCRKPLETLTYHENCGEIYCKQCYVRNFGPQGYGYSGVLQTPQ